MIDMLKIRWILIGLVSLGVVSANAEEYKSMIRYDRVWECMNLENTAQGKDVYIKCMKFDGTEDFKGKTYHRLVTFKKTYKDGDGYHVEDVLEYEGYMREEEGVVYTLIEESAPPAYDGFGTRYICEHYTGSSSTHDIREYILYDFHSSKDESYEGVTFVCDEAIYNQFTIVSVNEVEVDGEVCKSIDIAGRDPYRSVLGGAYTYIEGIGAVEYGCLNHHEYDKHITGMWMRNVINRVFDREGNVVFENLRGSQYNDLQYGSFIEALGVNPISDNKECDTFYDILGRRIAAPAPGQLYIQGGRKYIAK